MGFLPRRGCVNTTVWTHLHIEKAKWGELHENATSYLEQILKVTPHETAAVWPFIFHFINHPSKTNKTSGILLEKQG